MTDNNIESMLKSMERSDRMGRVYSKECIESVRQQIKSGKVKFEDLSDSQITDMKCAMSFTTK